MTERVDLRTVGSSTFPQIHPTQKPRHSFFSLISSRGQQSLPTVHYRCEVFFTSVPQVWALSLTLGLRGIFFAKGTAHYGLLCLQSHLLPNTARMPSSLRSPASVIPPLNTSLRRTFILPLLVHLPLTTFVCLTSCVATHFALNAFHTSTPALCSYSFGPLNLCWSWLGTAFSWLYTEFSACILFLILLILKTQLQFESFYTCCHLLLFASWMFSQISKLLL